MCTVTYIPTRYGYMLTSNRDEHVDRKSARFPVYSQIGEFGILYPRDGEAGGTWIAADHAGRAACLMNGAFEAHERTPPYRKSRGLIFLDLFRHPTFRDYCKGIDLAGIEPFTLLLIPAQKQDHLLEFVWDGKKKHTSEKKSDSSYIWASATLYDIYWREKRQEWFSNFLANGFDERLPSIRAFHHFDGQDNPENGILMNRNNVLKTVSITSVQKDKGYTQLVYENLKDRPGIAHSVELLHVNT